GRGADPRSAKLACASLRPLSGVSSFYHVRRSRVPTPQREESMRTCRLAVAFTIGIIVLGAWAGLALARTQAASAAATVEMPAERIPRGQQSAPTASELTTGMLRAGARTTDVLPIRQDLYVTDNSVFATAISGNTLYLGGAFTNLGPATGSGVPVDAST